MITIGADPEFFVVSGWHFVSGHSFQFGAKDSPLRTSSGMIHNDGLALECNVYPSNTKQDFIKNVTSVIADLQEHVTKLDDKAFVVARPSVFFGRRRLSCLPEFARDLGCVPDYNAYTGRRNPRPRSSSPIRTGSGHIHLGFARDADVDSGDHLFRCRVLIQQLDFFLGLPSLLWDTDNRRRTLYGKAGAFRPKGYGVEYRTLSNRWTADHDLIGFVFEAAQRAYSETQKGNLVFRDYPGYAERVINEGNADWPDENPELYQYLTGGFFDAR